MYLIVILCRNNPEDVPTKEATAIRKRLLESFSEYDAIAKKIHKFPCPGGPGSSQARLQTAILTRANLFLQKNMFPLQVGEVHSIQVYDIHHNLSRCLNQRNAKVRRKRQITMKT